MALDIPILGPPIDTELVTVSLDVRPRTGG